jgi:hypothetical protein
MSEHHTITGAPRGEPRPEGHVGARIHVPLTGTPSPRWSRGLSAHLAAALTGHEAVGHLRLNEVVQGADIVLDGVSAPHASALAEALIDAVDETNRCAEEEEHRPHPACNMSREEADRIAAELRLPLPAATAPARAAAALRA